MAVFIHPSLSLSPCISPHHVTLLTHITPAATNWMLLIDVPLPPTHLAYWRTTVKASVATCRKAVSCVITHTHTLNTHTHCVRGLLTVSKIRDRCSSLTCSCTVTQSLQSRVRHTWVGGGVGGVGGGWKGQGSDWFVMWLNGRMSLCVEVQGIISDPFDTFSHQSPEA